MKGDESASKRLRVTLNGASDTKIEMSTIFRTFEVLVGEPHTSSLYIFLKNVGARYAKYSI